MSFAGAARGDDGVAKPLPRGEFALSDLPGSDSAPIKVDTSIGTVALFPQRFEDIGAFSKLPADESPASRLRLYLPYIAARADALTVDGETRIDEASSRQLSDEDLERIADAYLSMPQSRQNANGGAASSSAMARTEGESATAFLDRRLRADHERQMEDLKGTYEALGHPTELPLASALADVDRQASSLRDTATKSMLGQTLAGHEGVSELGLGATAEAIEGPGALLASDADIAASDGGNRARDEEMALTRSIGIVTTQSAILVASLSETATRFLRQFSETTQRLEEAARTSARTILVAVLIMTALAGIAAAAAIMSYIDERENRQTTKLWQDSVVQSMKDTSAAQAAQIRSLEDRIRAMSDRPNAPAASPPAAAPAAPATSAAAPKAESDAAAPTQPVSKSASSKHASKRKSSH
jgi:hypothetical protein